ncbi:hypothetical protein Hypma_004687, partial [Hypsizygus marmoreus]
MVLFWCMLLKIVFLPPSDVYHTDEHGRTSAVTLSRKLSTPFPLLTRSRTKTTVERPSSPLSSLPSLPPTSPSSSESSSDVLYTALPLHIVMSSTSSLPTATIKVASSGKLPILTPGDITPQVLSDLVHAYKDFFDAKNIDDDVKVKKILSSFRDNRIRDWINADHARFTSLSFADFMIEFRANYLDPEWESQLRCVLLSSRLDPNKSSFWDWAANLQSTNSLLFGTSSYLDVDALRSQLEAGIDTKLDRRCVEQKLNEVKCVEDGRQAELKRHREISEDVLRHSKCPAFSEPSCHGNQSSRSSTTSAANRESNTLRSSTPSDFIRLPPLSESERTLLADNHGCFKCRHFHINHSSKSCPNDFPNGATYHTLTARDIPSHNTSSASSSKSKPIAAVAFSSWSEPIASTSSVAAVLPNSPAVLGNGSDSEDDLSDEVSTPFSIPHYVWKGSVVGPNVSAPVTVSMLIDSGSHIILINPGLVAHLGLHRPLPVDVAMSEDGPKTPKTLLEYCHLSVTLLDQSWTSNIVCAIIAPGLCSPIILGLLFLHTNHIVVDHHERTAIDKRSKYDLLNPTVVPPINRK